MQIPSIQIAQQYAKIGIDADIGKQSIEQPHGDLSIKTTKLGTSVSLESLFGDLQIDSSKALDALGMGHHLEMMKRVYDIALKNNLQTIAEIAERGDRLADISKRTNAIANISEEIATNDPPPHFEYLGEAMYDNVDITYTPRHPDINFTGGTLNITSKVNAPIISYERGKLDVYLRQRNSITITPPQIDVQR